MRPFWRLSRLANSGLESIVSRALSSGYDTWNGPSTVVRAGSEGAYGNAIHIKHPDGKTTLYAHLSGINVKAGQKVKVGQQIGKSGNTGRSFGAHLHFEVRGSDRYGGDINPASWH